jgi:hypothetical protein
MTIRSKFATSFLILVGVALFIGTPHAHAHGDEGEEILSEQDIQACVEMAKNQFALQYGNWMLKNRLVKIETFLSPDGDDLDIRIHYNWGAPKMRRYFCGYEIPGRLGCDPAFSGPGAL